MKKQINTYSDDEGSLSADYKLFATILCGDDSDQAIMSADEETLKSLVAHLQDSGMEDELRVSLTIGSDARSSMISYVKEFAQRGADHIRLSGASDVASDDEARHNIQKNALNRAGFRYEEDQRGEKINYIQSQWQSNDILYRHRIKTVGKPPLERMDWLPPLQFIRNNHVHSRKKPALMKILIDIYGGKNDVTIAGVNYKPSDIIEIYSVKGPPTYYINPIANDFIVKKCGWPVPIPENRKHWMPLGMLLEDGLKSTDTKVNIAKLSLLVQVLLSDSSASFFIDGQSYNSSDLFGYYSRKGPYSYYSNPIAICVIEKALNRMPNLPESKAHWKSAFAIALKFSNHYQAPYYTQLFNELAAKILSQPDQPLNIASNEQPKWVTPSSVVGRFRRYSGQPSYFFNPEAEEFFCDKIGIYPDLPMDKQDYISDRELSKKLGLPVLQAKKAIRKIAEQLRKLEKIERTNSVTGVTSLVDSKSVIIDVVYADQREAVIFCEPYIADQYFGKDKLIQCSAQVTIPQRKGQSPLMLPLEKSSWIFFSAVRAKLGIYSATDPLSNILKQRLENLHEQGIEGIGYFYAAKAGAAGNGGVYFVNPSIIGEGKLISPASLLELREKIAPSTPLQGWRRGRMWKAYDLV